MKVLIACEYSGVVREAFSKLGHDAVSCDLLPTEIPGKHYQGDIFDIAYKKWDLLIAHPPCTYLCNSGVSWLHKIQGRWDDMRKGADFFKKILSLDIDRICIENPIQHKYAKEIILKSYTQLVQPWMFGHMESKATCLWLKNLPKLIPTNIVKNQMFLLPNKERQKLHWLGPSKNRAKLRSRTYDGIANAMATQWNNF